MIMAIAIPFAADILVSAVILWYQTYCSSGSDAALEQVVRVVTIYLLGAMMYQKGKIDASVAVWGLAAGEIFSCFLTWFVIDLVFEVKMGSGAGEPIRKSSDNCGSMAVF